MIRNSPQIATNELLKRISKYDLKNLPSEFEVKLFLREAEKVKKVSLSDSYMLAGIIYSLTGDIDKTKDNFEKALANEHQEYETIIANYAQSLKILGKYEEAFDVLDANYIEGSHLLADNAYLYAMSIGLLEKAGFYNKKLKDFSNYENKYFDQLELHIGSCEEMNVSPKELHSTCLLVTEACHEYSEIIIKSNVSVSHGSTPILILYYFVEADVQAIANIELSIADRMSKLDDFPSLVNKIIPVILKS